MEKPHGAGVGYKEQVDEADTEGNNFQTEERALTEEAWSWGGLPMFGERWNFALTLERR